MNKDDPNANLFGAGEDEKSEEEFLFDQMYGKNHARAEALKDLIFDDMTAEIDSQDMPEEAKREMLFKMTVNSVLDMMMDAVSVEESLDMTFSFDMFMGVAITNKRYGVNLFKEHEKALATVKPSDYGSDEEYRKALEEFEEGWWYIPQPRLDKRHPNDAILESLNLYGLTDQ